MSAGPVLGFRCEWFDTISGQLTTLFLKFFLDDNTIEILTDGTRCLLKRIYYAEVGVDSLFVGNSILVFNRLLVIKEYCNEATVRYMGSREEHYLVLVSQGELACSDMAKAFSLAKQFDLKVGKVRTVTALPTPVLDTNLGDIVVEFVGFNKSISEKFIEQVSASGKGRLTACTASIDSVSRLFSSLRANNVYTALPDCSLCLIKPHVLRDQKVAPFLEAIANAGFEICGVYLVHMTIAMAKELLDVYHDVYPSYTQMIDQMVSGPVLALRIVPSAASYDGDMMGGSVVERFRVLAGPLNSELASKLRPTTLRARFGYTEPGPQSLNCNAVHCSDLPEDGEMECRYFLGTLASL